MKRLTQEQIKQAIKDGRKELKKTKRDCAYVYPLGFVPNCYKWGAPAERVVVTKDEFWIQVYDRKRSWGQGPYISTWFTKQTNHDDKRA